MRSTQKLLRLLSLLLAVAMIAAACGSDGATDEASEADTTEEATEVEEAEPEVVEEEADDEEAMEEEADDAEAMEEEAEPEEEEAAVSGDPVLVGFIGTATIAGQDAFDAMTDGLDAATAKINGEGGINGSPIEVMVCDDLGDPNLSVECAQSLIDAGVVAFVANFSPFGTAINPVIGEAGLAVIGGGLYTAGDFGIPFVYSTNGGAVTAGAGGPVACVVAGGTQLGLFHNAGPTGEQVIPLVQGFVVAPNPDVDLVGIEPIALDQADFAPAAAKMIAANPDCITAGVSLPLIAPLIEALRAGGYEGKIQIPGDFNTVEGTVASLGDASNNLVLSDIYDQSSPGYAEYVAAVAEVTGSDAEPIPLGVMGYLGLNIAADVIREAGPDAAAVTAAIPEVVVGYDTNGLTAAPLDWSVDGANPLGITNLRDTSLAVREIVDGAAVFGDGWTPIFPG